MCIRDSRDDGASLTSGSRWFNSNVAHHCPVLPCDTFQPFCGPFRQANGSACHRVASCDWVIGVHSESISGPSASPGRPPWPEQRRQVRAGGHRPPGLRRHADSARGRSASAALCRSFRTRPSASLPLDARKSIFFIEATTFQVRAAPPRGGRHVLRGRHHLGRAARHHPGRRLRVPHPPPRSSLATPSTVRRCSGRDNRRGGPCGPPAAMPGMRPLGGKRMTTEGRHVRILAVDDDPQIRRALASILRTRGYALELAASAEEAIAKAVDERPDLVILDLALPDRSGIEVCRDLRTWLAAPILVLSVPVSYTHLR